MKDLYLIVRIAGETVAIGAEGVGSVVEIDAISPVPRVPHHIVGLFALRSRILTVVDSAAALGFGRAPESEVRSAVIVTADGHGYALLVDEVVDVIEGSDATPCVAVTGPEWTRVSIGQVTTPTGDLLLVDPVLLIQGPEALAA